jgi:hypothetical protein
LEIFGAPLLLLPHCHGIFRSDWEAPECVIAPSFCLAVKTLMLSDGRGAEVDERCVPVTGVMGRGIRLAPGREALEGRYLREGKDCWDGIGPLYVRTITG